MRESLAALTTRGRVFAAAGAVACVLSVLMSAPAVGRIGVLVLALPFVSSYLIGRARYRLALSRSVSPSVVSAGTSSRGTAATDQ